MRAQIGEAAGKVWQELKKNGEVSLSQLPRRVKDKDVIVYQALGWLACENKVAYQVKGNKTSVKLTE